ncbi:MAG: DUF1016 domain-containing protein [Bacteroidetes bacterium]|nr:MAG: DUF1016 domain-containing protein [Bacteroidota bacterium]TAG86100.1 MAG: DUF1016 domain-containing protein [Bacteroidota bacterium]
MENQSITKDNNYQRLIDILEAEYLILRQKARKAIDTTMLLGYWRIGQYVIEYEQKGNIKSEYGKKVLLEVSKDLRKRVGGKGLSRTNLVYMRLIYLKYPKSQTLSDQLSWSHYVSLLSIHDDLERSFYEKQCINESWSVRELERQMDSALFQRFALSKNKEEVLKLSQEGQKYELPQDILKDPYVFEFLGISEETLKKESQLEEKLIENLQKFLLELGKGFAYMGKQYRITLDGVHYFVDLVFYHRILKCFVLIDLKLQKVSYGDIGQMNMYINYFKTEENVEDDNEPIGIILSARKNDVMVEYALGGITNNLFVSRYQLYLPDKQELQQKVREILET